MGRSLFNQGDNGRRSSLIFAVTPKESERRQVTVMFADISGFTAMSEKMDAEEITTIMNACFAMMEKVIHHYGGCIDKFIGDYAMVVFGVSTAVENAAYEAINTAIEMRAPAFAEGEIMKAAVVTGRRCAMSILQIQTSLAFAAFLFRVVFPKWTASRSPLDCTCKALGTKTQNFYELLKCSKMQLTFIQRPQNALHNRR